MRVIEIVEPGGPDALRLSERPDPPLGEGQIRVNVHASGVNRADLLQRRGRYPAPAGSPPDVPGLEFAGTVEGVGPNCRLREAGDAVMGILGGGGYADTVVVPERETLRVPRGMETQEAGAIPEAFLTAWDALVRQANLRAGEQVLIHAVGSGVGTAAVQLARVIGASTIGTSRTATKLERARELGLGAGVVAEYPEAWVAEIDERTKGQGVDVILDLVGASYLQGNLKAIGNRGRWIVVGVPSGAKGEIDLRRLMARRASLSGTVLRARPPEEKALLARDFERTVVPLFERELLRPVIDRSLPATDAARAHHLLEANETFGKILLIWD